MTEDFHRSQAEHYAREADRYVSAGDLVAAHALATLSLAHSALMGHSEEPRRRPRGGADFNPAPEHYAGEHV